MKTNLKSRAGAVIIASAMALVGWSAFGLGSDYRNGEPVGGSSAWPEGLKLLVNATNRVHGFFVNAEDFFFYSGNATNLTEFLRDYSNIQGVEKHQLILHEGAGEAKSPWSANSRPCDWELFGCPKAWLVGHAAMAQGTNAITAQDLAANATNYVLEVRFWTGGKIALDQMVIPKNVEFGGDCFKNFESITNGMTRGEVERKLTLDGSLRTVSPVRFVDPGCPHFKIKVEFGFQRDARDQNRAFKGQDDRVTGVSTPYREEPFTD
jgi:hypothetical protein